MRTRTHANTHTYAQTHTCKHINARIHMCAYNTYIHTYTNKIVHTLIQINIRIHIHMLMLMRTYTHMHSKINAILRVLTCTFASIH